MTSFTDHMLCMELMEPLVPELCLDHSWTEPGNLPRWLFRFGLLYFKKNGCFSQEMLYTKNVFLVWKIFLRNKIFVF